jgi:hypothetical protein
MAALAFVPLAAHAQPVPAVPNAGLENWSSRTTQSLGGPVTYQAPVNWDLGFVSSLLVLFSGQPPSSARSTIAHTGAASLVITTDADSSGGDVITQMGYTPQVIGGLSLWARSSYTVVPGAPDNEPASVLLIATRSRPGAPSDTVGFGGMQIEPTVANTWFQVSGGIFYQNPNRVQSDSLNIWLSYYAGLPGRKIWFDDLTVLRNPPTGISAPSAARIPLTISPNPASASAPAFLDIEVPSAGAAGLMITDMAGRDISRTRVVNLTTGANHLVLPTNGLPPGTYLVRLVHGSFGMRTAKVVVE